MFDRKTKVAIQATLHCLTGCAIGEVLGMVISTALHWSNTANVVAAVILSFVFGYALTLQSVMRAGLSFRQALPVALASDTVSITTMEVVDNTLEIIIPGALSAALTTWLFWWSLGLSLIVAFIITVPVNRWLIGRGKGHAVIHAYHDHD